MTVRVTREAEPQIEIYGAFEGEVLGGSIGTKNSLTFTPTDDFIVLVPKNDVTKPQLELGNTATNYQIVGDSFLDVSEEGKARRGRLWYNGTSHFMETGTITPGTDKVQDNAYGFLLKGTATSRYQPQIYIAPTTNVLTGLFDLAGVDLASAVTPRVDGVVDRDIPIGGAPAGDNFAAKPIYFGARVGKSFFFNGYEDTSIIRFGPTPDETTIGKVESYVASKTPEPTL